MLKLDNLRPWENVLKVVKKHWIVYVKIWIYYFLWIIFTIILFTFFSLAWASLLNILMWMIFILFIFVEWLNHELDMYVVTNNRVIWIEQIWFLNRSVSETNLWQIQEVNSKAAWLLANLFNYGTLSIQTAWNKTTLKMDFCPDSIQTSRKILNIVDNYRESRNLWENKEF